jgi:uncharacterized membrane protein YjjB (DUF3815 family)
VFGVVSEALHGRLTAADGLSALRAARQAPAPFTVVQQLAGYTAIAVGLAMILRGSLADVVVAGVLGTAVGAAQLLQTRWPTAHQVFAPAGAAFGVTLAVLLLARTGLDLGVFPPIIAPLVTLLPGALLTTGVIELATGQMISGAGRLAAGAMRLALLALGIIAAGQLVGVPATSLDDAAADPLGVAAQWIGVAVFGGGVVLARVARRSALPWILLILYAAYAGQLIGGALLGNQLSAFVGAVVMTPIAMFASTQRTGPSTLVSFLPGFWLLVPGAVGLTGFTQFLGADRLDGLATLAVTGTTMVSIAFGVLIGLSLGTVAGLGDQDGLRPRSRPRTPGP